MGGQPRNGFAAVDTTTKTVTSWNPNVEGGYCESVAVSGSTVYLGGSFETVGGQVRNGLAAVDATTAAPSDWNPDVDDFATKILVDGSTVYVGGYFQRVGAKARTCFAAIDATTGIARWNVVLDLGLWGFPIESQLVNRRIGRSDLQLSVLVPLTREGELRDRLAVSSRADAPNARFTQAR